MIKLLGQKRAAHVLLQTSTGSLSCITGIRSVSTMEQQSDYSKWSIDDLINRVTSIEQQLQIQTLRYEGK